VLKKCHAAAGTAEADATFRLAVKTLDRAAAKNLIHANTAARTKSRLSRVLKDAKAAPAAASE
jgi:small subunit ribosomal protein S20